MNLIIKWLRDTTGVTPFMARAHFRPFLPRLSDTSPSEHYIEFSPDRFYHSEYVAPGTNNSHTGFPGDRLGDDVKENPGAQRVLEHSLQISRGGGSPGPSW